MDQAKAQSVLNGLGIDWSFLKNMNWLQLLQFIQAIIAMFKSQSPKQLTKADCTPNEAAKAHFEVIKCVAECGCTCCEV